MFNLIKGDMFSDTFRVNDSKGKHMLPQPPPTLAVPSPSPLPFPKTSAPLLSNTVEGNLKKPENIRPPKVKKKSNFKTFLTILLIFLLLLTITYLSYDKIQSNNKVQSVETTISTLEIEKLALTEENISLKEEVSLKETLLSAREELVQGLVLFNNEATKAESFIDVSVNREVVNQAKETAYSERKNKDNIDSQKVTIATEQAKIVEAIKFYEEQKAAAAVEAEKVRIAEENAAKAEAEARAKEIEQQKVEIPVPIPVVSKAPVIPVESAAPPAPVVPPAPAIPPAPATNLSGTLAEKALDDATGNRLNMIIVEADVCGNNPATLACVRSDDPNTVRAVRNHVERTDYSYNTWYMLMMHENAHATQFQDYNKFMKSPNLKNLFGGNLESFADCMAEAEIGSGYSSGYHTVCSPEQLAAGVAAWSGNFG